MDQETTGHPEGRPWRKRRWILTAAMLLLLLVGGLGLFWRRDSAADRWMAAMRARGEKFTFEELGLTRPRPPDTTPDAIDLASSRLRALNRCSVQEPYEDLTADPPDRQRVDWQQPRLYSLTRQVMNWEAAAQVANDLGPAIAQFHAALQPCPKDPGWDYLAYTRSMPNFVRRRETAQALYDLVMIELHRGRLDAAQQDLVSLLRIGRLHEEGWTLVNQMIRTAILALGTEAVWQTLQAPGWTEPQLATLQRELERFSIIPHLPKTFEVERASGLVGIEMLRQQGLSAFPWVWAGSTGQTPPPWLRELAYHFWCAALSGHDRLELVQRLQETIDLHREWAAGVPLVELRPPVLRPAPWWGRFDFTRNLFPYSGAPLYVRATQVVAHNETERLLAITALALERHRLRHGRYPESLAALQPEFLSAAPRDPISGDPLDYRGSSNRIVRLSATAFDALTRAQSSPGWQLEMRPGFEGPIVWPSAAPMESEAPSTPEDAAPASPKAEPILPLVVFDEVPLRDVILTLARQAEINLIFHPAAMDHLRGKVNIRLEQVTALQVLDAILNNNSLRRVQDPRTGIHIIRTQ